jgi:hypothetical protein
MESKGTMPIAYRKDALIIFILLALTFAYFYQGGGSNENSRFSLIFSSIQEGRLSIDDYYNKADTYTIDNAYFNGHYYSDKAIGPAVLGAVFYTPLSWMQQNFNHPSQANVKWILTFLVIGLPAAIAGSLMYILCLYISKSRLQAYLVTLAITLGTLYFPFSIVLFSHQLTSSLLFGAFVMIFFLKNEPRKRNIGYLFLIGLLLGWAVICEFPSVVIVFALIIYYFFFVLRNRDYRNWQSIVLPMVGGMIPIVLQLVYNKLCFGGFFSIGYSNLNNQIFSTSMSKGLMGILWPNLIVLYYTTFHPLMGIFWQSPVLLLSFVGAVFMFRERSYRAEAVLAVWIICSYFILMSGYYMWWGGFSLGPRHIIPALPFFCMLLIFVPKRFNWPFIGLCLVSIGQMIIAAASNVEVQDTMVKKISSLNFFEYSNIYSFCLKLLLQGKFNQNLGQQFFHLQLWSSLIPLLVLLIGITIFFFRNEIKSNHVISADYRK